MRVQPWLEESGLTLIRGWARAGVSPRTIAGRMGVGLRTLERWRRKYPALALALSGTKEVVDSQVEDALLQKALGYESIEHKVEVSAKGERKEVSTVKQVGPDVSASGDLSKFSDGGETSGWAEDAMKWAVGAGILTGKSGTILDPTGTASRAEVATILMRWLEK